MLTTKEKNEIKKYLKIVSGVDVATLQRSELPFPIAELILEKAPTLTNEQIDQTISEVLAYNKKILDKFRIKHNLPNGIIYEASQLYFRTKVKNALKKLISITEEFWKITEKQLGHEYFTKLGLAGRSIEKCMQILQDEKYRVGGAKA